MASADRHPEYFCATSGVAKHFEDATHTDIAVQVGGHGTDSAAAANDDRRLEIVGEVENRVHVLGDTSTFPRVVRGHLQTGAERIEADDRAG